MSEPDGEGGAFGVLLRQYRAAARLTQEEVAEQAGLSARAITDLERGVRRFPYSETVRRLSEALQLSPEERAALFRAGRRSTRTAAMAAGRAPLVDRTPPGDSAAPAGADPLGASPASPTNLPSPPTPLIGRDEEVATLRERLLHHEARLLTLTGPGGTGKTRLALAVAATVVGAAFEQGVFLVDLTPIRDPRLVVPTIAQTLQVREAAGRVLADVLREYLRDRRLLLVLDNFEQVLAAARDIGALLAACRGVTVLVTSRAPLHLQAEQEVPVAPLPVPDLLRPASAETLAEAPSVALFVECAHAIDPGFALTDATAHTIAEICARLDGLPLAIELAAARTRGLSPQGILARLGNRLSLLTGGRRDQPARHQTLRKAIDWSYELLPPTEQALFRRMAVFSAGCTLEAVEAVCQLTCSSELSTLDQVTSLLENNLLRQVVQLFDGEPRYLMLETVREFALERLEESGEAEALAARHADYMLQLAEWAEPELRGRNQSVALARVAADYDNLRSALEWLAATVRPELGLRIGAALWRFWQIRGEYAEPRSRLEHLLAMQGSGMRTLDRARALACTGRLAYYQGDFEAARRLFVDSLALCREVDARHDIAFNLMNLAMLADGQGELERAHQVGHEALAAARAGGGDWILAQTLFMHGVSVFLRGDADTGRRLVEEGLAVARRLKDDRAIAYALVQLATIVHGQGDAAGARGLLEEAVSIFRRIGDRGWVPTAFAQLGLAALDLHDSAAALASLKASLIMAQASGARPGIALALEGFACVLAASRRGTAALRLAAAAAALREALAVPGPLAWRRHVERWLSLARAEVRGREAQRAAWAEGRVLPIDEAIRYALAVEDHTETRARERSPTGVPLTTRECDIVGLVARGLTSRQIARELVVTERTVNTHLEHVRNKLGVRSRAQIVARVADLSGAPDEATDAIGIGIGRTADVAGQSVN